MSDILADYREWRDQQATRVSTHSGGCHMWHKDCMIHRLADALERARLTDAERLLIQSAAEEWEEHAQRWRDNDERVADEAESNADTLRGPRERLT